MSSDEEVIRKLYAASDERATVVNKIASMFSCEGYMWDMVAGMKFRGQAIGESIAGFARAFPDVRRELLNVYVAQNVIIVELATRGTHIGELPLPAGALAPTGKSIDVPSCDVFHLGEGAKITSFHCYREAAVMQRQLGVG
ncbi:ester cyclase [Paraburkholderia sp. CNPSo 3274]|uniref:nuclear transport factor 2 family protein n=1 Tax=Paraburkholderia sp. CNPSo 3274 TaxID=2940932 RepID=UPI0020B66125|nr:nuclear transport factor 2 family protein [Paraburkholderia sp. CNPSo 3274]MCP3712968.1 ester cyclase [Paraburkholderia sp. CNPSo 3274]